jgi:hypothetical protein
MKEKRIFHGFEEILTCKLKYVNFSNIHIDMSKYKPTWLLEYMRTTS